MVLNRTLVLILSFFSMALMAEEDPLNDWIKVSSPHLILYTDHRPDTAIEVVNKLTTFKAVVIQFMKGTENEYVAPLSLVLFGDKSMWSRLRDGRNFAGYFTFPIYGPLAVVGPGGGKPNVEVLYHEYVHYLVNAYIPHRFPQWYNEGMAEFFSSVAIEPDYIYIGAMPKQQVKTIEQLGLLSTKGLFTQTGLYQQTPRHVAKFYSSAWLLSHYFTLGARNGFPSHYNSNLAFMAKQREGMGAEKAFEQSFDISLKELDREVQRYARSTKKDGFAIEPLKLNIETEVEKLSSAQAKAHLATVYGWREKDSVGYEYLLAAAEQNEPFALSVRALHHSLDKDTELALAKLEKLSKLENSSAAILYNQFKSYGALAELANLKSESELAEKYKLLSNTALDKSLTLQAYMPSMLAQVQRLLKTKSAEKNRKKIVKAIEQLTSHYGNHHFAHQLAAKAYLQLGDLKNTQSSVQRAINLLPHKKTMTSGVQAILDELAQLQAEP